MLIKVENTAISNGVAQSVKSFDKTVSPILDYGAGKLRNAKYLIEKGFNVSVLDIPEQVIKWSEEDKSLFSNVYTEIPKDIQFKTIFNTFVLNVVPSENMRKEILSNIHSLLTFDGKVVIEVRRDKGIMSSKHIEDYNDGYILGNGNVRTFQKPFTTDYIEELVSPYFYISKLKIMSDSIIVIGEKKI